MVGVHYCLHIVSTQSYQKQHRMWWSWHCCLLVPNLPHFVTCCRSSANCISALQTTLLGLSRSSTRGPSRTGEVMNTDMLLLLLFTLTRRTSPALDMPVGSSHRIWFQVAVLPSSEPGTLLSQTHLNQQVLPLKDQFLLHSLPAFSFTLSPLRISNKI